MDHIANRDKVISSLKAELMGPEPIGEERTFVKGRFEGEACLFALNDDGGQSPLFDEPCTYRWSDDKMLPAEEVLRGVRPDQRYGVAVLYPPKDDSEPESPEEDTLDSIEEEPISAAEEQGIKNFDLLNPSEDTDANEADYFAAISGSQIFQPSSIGVSFFVDVNRIDKFEIELTGGRYECKEVLVCRPGKGEDEDDLKIRRWYFRKPVRIHATLDKRDLRDYSIVPLTHVEELSINKEDLDIVVQCRVEPYGEAVGSGSQGKVLTIIAQNSSVSKDRLGKALFQTEFKVRAVGVGSESRAVIGPYPSSYPVQSTEDQSFELLYRDFRTYAVGHG